MKANRRGRTFASAGSTLLSRAPSSENIHAAPKSLPLPSSSSSGPVLTDMKELNALRRNVASLTQVSRNDARTIESLRKELKFAQDAVANAESATARAVADALAAAAAAGKPETDPYEARTQALTKQVAKVQKDLRLSRKSNTELNEKYRNLQDALKRVTSISSSNNDPDSMKIQRQLEAVSAHAKTLMNKNAELEKRLKGIQVSEVSVTTLKSRVEVSEASRVQAEAEVDRLKEKLVAITDEMSHLRSDLDQCESRRRNVSSDLARASADVLRLKNKLRKSEKLCQESIEDLKASRAEALQAERLKKEVAQHKIMQAQLEGTISSLQAELDSMEAVVEENNNLKETIHRGNMLRVKEENQRATLTSALTKYKSAVEELHPQALLAKELKQKVDLLTKKIGKMVEMQGDDVLQLRSQIEGLKGTIQEQKSFMDMFTQLRMRMDDLELLNAESKKSVADAREIARVATEQKALLVKELKLMEEVAGQDAARDAANAEKMTRLQVDLASALRRENMLKITASKAQSQNDLRLEKIDALESEKDRLKDDATKLREQVDTLCKQIAVIKPELELMQAKLGAKQAEIDALEEKHKQQGMQLKEAKNANARVRRKSIIDMAKQSSQAAIKVKEALLATETELKVTVSKLVAAEEASESAFTCLSCMNIMKKPVTCIPCGHSFCEACLRNVPSFAEKRKRGSIGSCPECSSSGSAVPPPPETEYYIENQLLENLTARYVFRKQALGGLKGVMKQLQERMGSVK